MNTLKAIFATGIVALMIGLVSVAPVAVAGDQPTSWDQFQQCKISCNESYGGIDILPPAVRGGGALGWSNCVLKCERDYWKDVDQETKDLQ
jgi:hypothetical protein